ncbi:hypothetical protein S245_027070 [Arachis hypogaea]
MKEGMKTGNLSRFHVLQNEETNDKEDQNNGMQKEKEDEVQIIENNDAGKQKEKNQAIKAKCREPTIRNASSVNLVKTNQSHQSNKEYMDLDITISEPKEISKAQSPASPCNNGAKQLKKSMPTNNHKNLSTHYQDNWAIPNFDSQDPISQEVPSSLGPTEFVVPPNPKSPDQEGSREGGCMLKDKSHAKTNREESTPQIVEEMIIS